MSPCSCTSPSAMSMSRMVSKRASRHGAPPPPQHATHPADAKGATTALGSNPASGAIAGGIGSGPASAASVLSGPSAPPYSPRYSQKYGQQLLHGAVSPAASASLPSLATAAMDSTAVAVTNGRSPPFASQTSPGSGPDPVATGATAGGNHSSSVPGDVVPGVAAAAATGCGGLGSSGGAASCTAVTAAADGGGGVHDAVGRGSVPEGCFEAAARAEVEAEAASTAARAAEAAACGVAGGESVGANGGTAGVVYAEQVDVSPALAVTGRADGADLARQGGA